MDGDADLFGGEARVLENDIQGRKIGWLISIDFISLQLW